MVDRPCCCRCYEDFPVAKEPTGWAMGFLRPVTFLDRRIRRKHNILTHDPETREVQYLCGNCYFDLTDEEDEKDG
jgi:hypothetical protein